MGLSASEDLEGDLDELELEALGLAAGAETTVVHTLSIKLKLVNAQDEWLHRG
jgi:hypothetical protein